MPPGTGHRAKQWVRVSRDRGSTRTPSRGKAAPGNRAGERAAPGLALPRVLPVTPPGEVQRLPRPARSPEESEEGRKPPPWPPLSPLRYIHARNRSGTTARTAPGRVSAFYLVCRSQPTAMFHRSPGRSGSRLPGNIARAKATPTAGNSEGRQCGVLARSPLLTKCVVNREAWSDERGVTKPKGGCNLF